MPVRRVIIRSCDLCNGEPAREIRFGLNGDVAQIDVCEDHEKPVRELFERYALASSKPPGRAASPHRCELCGNVISRRVHAIKHVERMHGYDKEAAAGFIRPMGIGVVKRTRNSPADRPHRCEICKKPYSNRQGAKRHVEEIHPDKIKPGRQSVDYITLVEDLARV